MLVLTRNRGEVVTVSVKAADMVELFDGLSDSMKDALKAAIAKVREPKFVVASIKVIDLNGRARLGFEGPDWARFERGENRPLQPRANRG